MQVNTSTLKTGTSMQPNLTSQPDFALINVITGSVAIAFPAVVLCAIIGFRKYQARVMRQRIQRLNRLWNLDSSKKPS